MTEALGSDKSATPFDPGTPYAIEDLARTLMRLTRGGVHFLEALPISTFFAPQGDRWSPAEHVRHLRKSSAPLLLGYRLPRVLLRLLYGSPKAPSRTFDKLRRDYRAALDAGGQAGRFAPRPEPPPTDPAHRRTEILQRWLSTNEAVVQTWARWRSRELDQTLLPHPLLGKLTAREMAIFTVYHSSHHLSLIASRL